LLLLQQAIDGAQKLKLRLLITNVILVIEIT